MPLPRDFEKMLAEKTNEQLYEMVACETDYTPEALAAAHAEIERRNLEPAQVRPAGRVIQGGLLRGPTDPSLGTPQKMPLAGRILIVCSVVMGLALIIVGLQGLFQLTMPQLLDPELLDTPASQIGEPLAMIGTGVLIILFFGLAVPFMRANQRKQELASMGNRDRRSERLALDTEYRLPGALPPYMRDDRRARVPFSRGTAALAVVVLGAIEYGIWNGLPGSPFDHGLLAAFAVPLLYAITILFQKG
jgi:hypothetical protein